MSGASSLNIESVLKNARRSTGFMQDIVIPLESFRLDNGAAIGTTDADDAPSFLARDTGLIAISWDAGCDTSDVVRCNVALPLDFFVNPADEVGFRSTLKLWVKARHTKGGSNVASLNVQAPCKWTNPGWSVDADGNVTEGDGDTSINQFATVPESAALSVGYADGTDEKWRWYEIDLSGGMTAAQRIALKPGATFQIRLNPSEDPAASNSLDICAVILRYRRTAAPAYADWNRMD